MQDEAALLAAIASAAATVGEPWLSYFEPQKMEEHLQHCGFTDTIHFGSNEAEAIYLTGRKDGLHLPTFLRLATAIVR